MPPRPLIPNQPRGATDMVPYNPYPLSYPASPASAPAATASRTRVVATQNGPMFLPGDVSDDDARTFVAAYDAYIAKLTQALQETSGLQRMQIESQIEDAKKGRENAMAIANLQAETSRYGTDVQRETQMAQLKQNQRQFDASHALDMRRYGLDVAKAYTAYSSTPDMMFARNDFMNAMGRVGQGLTPTNVMNGGQRPQAKGWEDFAALSGFNTPVGDAGRSGGGGGNVAPQGPTGGGGGGTDQRISAANAVMKAIPPSDGVGTDEQDWAALRAIENLYVARRPGSVERLGAQRQKIANAGLARLGYDPALVNEDYMRARPGQQSVRRA